MRKIGRILLHNGRKRVFETLKMHYNVIWENEITGDRSDSCNFVLPASQSEAIRLRTYIDRR